MARDKYSSKASSKRQRRACGLLGLSRRNYLKDSSIVHFYSRMLSNAICSITFKGWTFALSTFTASRLSDASLNLDITTTLTSDRLWRPIRFLRFFCRFAARPRSLREFLLRIWWKESLPSTHPGLLLDGIGMCRSSTL